VPLPLRSKLPLRLLTLDGALVLNGRKSRGVLRGLLRRRGP